MTNKEYMDLLEKYHDDPPKILVTYSDKLDISVFINTENFSKLDKQNMGSWDLPGILDISIIEIVNGILYMPVPNIMDSLVTTGLSRSEHLRLIRNNVSLFKIEENRLPNHHNASQIKIPYYSDEAECFQRELMGEIVLYPTHVKYVEKIIEKAHSEYLSAYEKILGRN